MCIGGTFFFKLFFYSIGRTTERDKGVGGGRKEKSKEGKTEEGKERGRKSRGRKEGKREVGVGRRELKKKNKNKTKTCYTLNVKMEIVSVKF